MSDKTDDEIRELLSGTMEDFTPHTVTDIEEYIRQLRAMKEEAHLPRQGRAHI